MSTKKRSKYTEYISEQTRKSKPLLERAHWQVQQLARMLPDRQPDAEKQTPETEWRRQRDIASSLGVMRDVMIDVIKDLEDFGMYEKDLEKLIQIEEEVEENPCRDPKNFVEWLSCWQKVWIYLKQCCEEHHGYWRKYFHTFHWLGQRHDDAMFHIQQKFDEIGDFIDGQQPPPDLPAGDPSHTVRVFYQSTKPAALEEGDIWIQEM